MRGSEGSGGNQGSEGCQGSGGILPSLPPLFPVLLALACSPGVGSHAGVGTPDSSYVMQRVGGNALVIPRGFRVGVFAEHLDGVRFMAVGPDRQVYASITGSGRVVALPDRDEDGHADTVRTVIAGLDGPHGLAFRGDTLYVAEESRVIRLLPPDGRVEVVVPDLPSGGGHSTRTIVFRNDDLLVSIGSSCNLCDERDERRAAIMRYALDGTGARLLATGLRNSVGLALQPGTGALFATNNDRDRLGDDRPPDRVNLIRDGGWYGWPECNLPGTPNPEYERRTTRCDQAIGPAIRFPAHSAPLGLAFYTGTAFPEEYRGNLFVALHGSWDRSFPTGYKVVRIRMDGAGPSAEPEDFVTGWQIGRRWWGRPVDVQVAPDGSLLISDDFGGRIFRVSRDD
jgi:glucose/arabinose dehydrogenase